MKCSFCGMEFEQEEAQKGCSRCSLAKGCQLVRCPRCGYEMPLEPNWIKRLKAKRKQK
jgi:uncharacterized paraquat-inducible protein A